MGQSFKAKFGKNYANAAEESRRFAIFKENAAFIARHNADHKIGKESYTVGHNQFSDLTNAESRTSPRWSKPHKSDSTTSAQSSSRTTAPPTQPLSTGEAPTTPRVSSLWPASRTREA